MDIIDKVEDSYFNVSNAKLHGGMYKILFSIYSKVILIFPGLEAAMPRSKSGIEALCSVNLALEKTKNILHHCSECSKLYLAITGDSVLRKFEKAKSALADSLKLVEDIVPKSMGCQIEEIVNEIEGTQFSLDLSEKQVGDGIIALLQRKRKFNSDSNDGHDFESFHQDVCRLGITSSRAALTERRALKKLIERARVEGDKRKEEIVAFLFHLMRKYSKSFRTEASDDNDSQGSTTPRSPNVEGYNENINGPRRNGHAFGRQLSKLNSFNFAPSNQRSEDLHFPPEELRCPISLQLMYDPVIISSGQTYERLCIEQWLRDGHNTCPKTQHRLYNFDLTPNYCVRGLISSWCGQNGVPTPDAPPECLDLNYWRLALSEGESNSKSVDGIGSRKFKKGVNILSLEDGGIIEESEIIESMRTQEEGVEVNLYERYNDFLTILDSEVDMQKKCEVVEEIRHLLKEDEEARIVMGANGFVEALMQFLVTAVDTNNRRDQEVGAMTLFNLAVKNNRNTEMMLAAGMISLLEEMIANSNSHHGSATALYLTLSCLDEAKPIIASSKAVPFLILLLGTKNDQRSRHDSLHTVYNLSTSPSGIQNLLSAGIINSLSSLLTLVNGPAWIKRCMAVLLNIAATKEGKEEMTSNPDLITRLATILDAGESVEQEHAVACLLTLCTGNDKCSQMVLQEGVIPSLVSISVNGTMRGKEKAQKLLMLFREQRQSDSPTLVPIDHQQHSDESCDAVVVPVVSEKKVVSSKVKSNKKGVRRVLNFLWKSKASQPTRANVR